MWLFYDEWSDLFDDKFEIIFRYEYTYIIYKKF